MPLSVTRAKPNPAGKDRVGRTLTPPAQLAGEWVDIRNTGFAAVPLGNLELYHLAYHSTGAVTWESVIKFSGSLPGGQTMRIHSGEPIPLWQMRPEDRDGVDHHLFSNKNYVWNNDKPDTAGIWNRVSQEWIDKANYAAYPGEGRILNRVNNSLI